MIIAPRVPHDILGAACGGSAALGDSEVIGGLAGCGAYKPYI